MAEWVQSANGRFILLLGEFGTGNRETKIGVRRKDETDACGRAVNHGDYRFRQPKMVGEGCVKMRIGAVAGTRDFTRDAGIVAASLGVASAESAPGARGSLPFGQSRGSRDERRPPR